MSAARDLKPCPCCGGDAELDTRQGFRGMDGKYGEAMAVYCIVCTLTVSICKGDVPDVEPEQVIALWNRRPDEALAATPSRIAGPVYDQIEPLPEIRVFPEQASMASIAISLKRIADVLCPRVTGPENGSVFVGEMSDVIGDRLHDIALSLRP